MSFAIAPLEPLIVSLALKFKTLCSQVPELETVNSTGQVVLVESGLSKVTIWVPVTLLFYQKAKVKSTAFEVPYLNN